MNLFLFLVSPPLLGRLVGSRLRASSSSYANRRNRRPQVVTKERPRARPVARAQDRRQVVTTSESIRDGSRTRRSGRRDDTGVTHDPSKAIGESIRRNGVARRTEGRKDVVVLDVQLRPTLKVGLQGLDRTNRRIRRGWKTSDRESRTKMTLTIRLGEARGEKARFFTVDNHEGRRTPKGRQFRRSLRRRHGEEKRSLPLKLLEGEGRGPRREKVKDAPDVPRVVEATRWRSTLKNSLYETRDERMLPDGMSIERRKRRREDRAMEPNRPEGSPSVEHIAEIVEDDSQRDVRERKRSGTQKVAERVPDAIVSAAGRGAPASRDEPKSGVGDAVASQPPQILQTTRRRST